VLATTLKAVAKAIRATATLPRGLSDLALVYAAAGFNGVLGIAAVPVGVYVMGKAGYGLYSIYAIIFSYIVLAESGFTKNLVRLLSRDTDRERQVATLRAAFGFYLVLSLLLVTALPGLAWIASTLIFDLPVQHRTVGYELVSIAVVEYIVSISSSTTVWYGNANGRFREIAHYNILSGAFRYVLLYGSIWYFGTPSAAAAAGVLRRVADHWISRAVIGPLPKGSYHPTVRFRQFLEMAPQAAYLTSVQLCLTTTQALPAVLSSRFFGLAALGSYRAAFDLCNRVWFFSTGISFVAFPKLVRVFAEDRPAANGRDRAGLWSALTLSWLAYGAAVLGGTVLQPFLLKLLGLSGPDDLLLFMMVLAGVCLYGHAQLGLEVLQAASRYRQALLSAGAAALMMAVTNVLFRPAGVASAGYAWLVMGLTYSSAVDVLSFRATHAPTGVMGRNAAYKTMTLLAFGVSLIVTLSYGQAFAAPIALTALTLTAFAAFKEAVRARPRVPAV
jgi:O-antigen/teichoic acid export membrane protein